MRLLIAIIITMLMANVVCAADFPNPLVQGQVMVKGQAAPSTPNARDTMSLGLLRVDNGEIVFCAPAGPDEFVEGMTNTIVSGPGNIYLEFFAYPDPDCSFLPNGARSIASSDRYLVVFGAPGQPLLLVMVGNGPD